MAHSSKDTHPNTTHKRQGTDFNKAQRTLQKILSFIDTDKSEYDYKALSYGFLWSLWQGTNETLTEMDKQTFIMNSVQIHEVAHIIQYMSLNELEAAS